MASPAVAPIAVNLSATVPFEALLTAFINAIVTIYTTERNTMSQENRDEFDKLHIKNLKRIDRILDATIGGGGN